MSRFNHALVTGMLMMLMFGLLSVHQPVMAAQGLPFRLPQSFIESSALTLDKVEREWLDDHGKLRVGISIADYEPIDITTDRNRYQGISADYLSLVRDKLRVPVEVLGFSKREDAVAALLSGKIDVLTSVNGYERGFEGLLFSTNYMVDRSVIVGRDNNRVHDRNWAGQKIGFLDGYVDVNSAHAFYPDSEIILTPNLNSAMEALVEGDIDAFVGNELIVRAFKAFRPNMELYVLEDSALPDFGFAFATRREDALLVSLIDRALSRLDASTQRMISSRWAAGLSGSITAPYIKLSPTEKEWVKRNPIVTLATQQYPLYAFKNAEGHWEGLSVDILERISRMTGLQFVHKESFSTVQTLDMLSTGEAQMNTTLSKNEERKAFLNFTYSYGGAPWVFVVRMQDSRLGSLTQLSGKVLALTAQHVLEPMIRREYPEIILRTVSSFDQARKLVENGEALATIQNETQAYLYPAGQLKVGRSVDGRWSVDNFSVSKQYPELLDILNKALEAIPMADIRSLRIKWLEGAGILPPVKESSTPPVWFYCALLLLVLIVLLLVLLLRHLKVKLANSRVSEHVLQEQLAFQRRFLDGIPSPIFVVGIKGEIITCNCTYEERLATRLDRICGLTSLELNLYPKALAEQFHAELMALIQSRKPYYRKRWISFQSGDVEVYQWTVPFYSADGALEGLIGGWFEQFEHKQWDALR